MLLNSKSPVVLATGLFFSFIQEDLPMRHEIDFCELKTKLPPVISRDHVEKLLGGIISSKRLANLDSLGEGPKRLAR
jgi:hypothetical protein